MFYVFNNNNNNNSDNNNNNNNNNNKIHTDKIQTDLPIEANKPDIVVRDKIMIKCFVIDVTCPFEKRVSAKEKEKIEKYQDLKREILII